MNAGPGYLVKVPADDRPARQRLIDATIEVIGRDGLARATTREIARAAGCSEALLYKHFADKSALFLHVMAERSPAFLELLAQLPAEAGTGTVAGHLTRVVARALPFYELGIPTGSALFADPELLRRHRAGLEESGAGPHRPLEAVTAYLRAERLKGRLARTARPPAVAALLLGACYQRAFLRSFMGESAIIGTDEQFARDVVHTLLAGIAP